jgi:tetratricopeptide (TPR) repeat protein
MRECTDEWSIKNQLASLWMHRGMALMNLNSSPALLQAVSCFNQAIVLRQALPIESNHWFRYALSAGWINRADALRQLEQHWSQVEALKSYDEAIVLLRTLPVDQDPLYGRRLAITWLHRGVLLQQGQSFQSQLETVNSFREAIRVLELPNAARFEDHQVLLGAAWANLSGALADLGPDEANDAAAACVTALTYARTAKPTDPVFVEVLLKATDALCRVILKNRSNHWPIRANILTVTTDAIEEILHLIASQGKQIKPDHIELIRRVFRFGCWIYEEYQPHFLAKYIDDYLCLHRSECLELDPSSAAIARASVRRALGSILSPGFSFLATPKRDLVLGRILQLRLVAEQLQAPAQS